MIPDNSEQTRWASILSDTYAWIADDDIWRLASPLPVVEIILTQYEEDVETIYESSIWAVAMAYRDYKYGTNDLTDAEHAYARTRAGVLGTRIINNHVETVTLRRFLEDRDPGFLAFSHSPHPHHGPVGA